MQLPSIIQSFFPNSSSIQQKQTIQQQRTERLINIAYLALLSLSILVTISGAFLSLSFPLLGATICLISLAISSCLLVLFPMLPYFVKRTIQKKSSESKTTTSSLRALIRYFNPERFNKICH